MMIWPLTDCEECLRQSGGYIYVDDAAIHAKGSQNEEQLLEDNKDLD